MIRGRDYVVPQDVLEVIPDVLRHRLVLSYDALADEVSPEDIIARVLQTVGLPQVAAQAVAPTAPVPAGAAMPPAPNDAQPQPSAPVAAGGATSGNTPNGNSKSQ